MLDDRGPQITFEVVNGIDLTDKQLLSLPYEVPLTHGKHDMRTPIMKRATQLFAQTGIPITPRFGGNFALDLAVEGVKYSVLHGGTDRHMSEALPPEVRSIDFRQEDPAEFPDGYNIVIWNGKQHLHHGLLEYLQSRHAN